ncbi:MAG: acyl-CoA reductase [Bacteroidetes bacterium]|nr:MAG: acyl-CoA reductase [Bacteroidota bacterium]TAG89739.1 MAG: acyl-CoA reductase [Bacteroidota bacterium]
MQHEILTILGKKLEKIDLDTWKPLTWAYEKNRWFTPINLKLCMQEIIKSLQKENIEKWVNDYLPKIPKKSKKIGIIMAGNIPAVGWADFLAVLVTGHESHIKLSSQDEVLIPEIAKILFKIAPELKNKIHFDLRLKNCDAYIATGSDNSARYFEQYFGNKPHIIRKNRHSLAIIDGTETKQDFEKLSNDIFTYFGLGCRNVCKLLVPENYDLKDFFEGIFIQKEIANHYKYFNNYEYQRAVYLVNIIKHFDNGFVLLRENKQLVAPTGVIYYQSYENKTDLDLYLEEWKDKIQVIVSKDGTFPNSLPFGTAQTPFLWDYADNINTLQFLVESDSWD